MAPLILRHPTFSEVPARVLPQYPRCESAPFYGTAFPHATIAKPWGSCSVGKTPVFVVAFGAMPDVHLNNGRSQNSYVHPQSYTLLNTRNRNTKVLRQKYTVFMLVLECE